MFPKDTLIEEEIITVLQKLPEGEGLSTKKITAQTKIPRSTIYQSIKIMERAGLIVKAKGTGKEKIYFLRRESNGKKNKELFF